MCSAPGTISILEGDQTLDGVHFMRRFAMRPPMPPDAPPFYLCQPCSKDCTSSRRSCDNVAERKELRGSRKVGRKEKRKRDSNLSGIELPQSSGTMTSPLDRQRKSSYVEVPITPIPFVLDSEECDGNQSLGEDDDTPASSHRFPINAYGPEIWSALADLQAD